MNASRLLAALALVASAAAPALAAEAAPARQPLLVGDVVEGTSATGSEIVARVRGLYADGTARISFLSEDGASIEGESVWPAAALGKGVPCFANVCAGDLVEGASATGSAVVARASRVFDNGKASLTFLSEDGSPLEGSSVWPIRAVGKAVDCYGGLCAGDFAEGTSATGSRIVARVGHVFDNGMASIAITSEDGAPTDGNSVWPVASLAKSVRALPR